MIAKCKKISCILLAICFVFSMICPTYDVQAFEHVQPSLKAARKTDPEEWNKKDIKAYEFSFDDNKELATYMLTGGLRYYNKNFDSPDRMVKITVVGDGVFYLVCNLVGEGSVSLYNADKKKIVQSSRKEKELDYFYPIHVKDGDIFYVKMPTGMAEATLFSCVFKDSFTKLKSDSSYLQIGKGTATYHEFTLKKRAEVTFDILPLNQKGGSIYAEIEKNNKGRWSKVGSSVTVKQTADEDADSFIYGFDAGQYRLKLKAGKEQISAIDFDLVYFNKNVAYKKSKAQTIGFNKSKRNIYTTGEQKDRWYKVKVKSKKSRSLYYLSGSVKDGFKFTLYQKGKKKPIKTTKVMGYSGKLVKLPKKKGTYYIKVSKIGKQANGMYDIEFSDY
ncbi:MAG: hypothetical protein Q4D45_12460 [Lachnospiraceae bacterium]|nr:hypothetical protein [Lachnospiraceae bacterium]